MPTYQYKCVKGHETELVQKITDKGLTECPTCGAACGRVPNAAGFILKGPGWAADGYSKEPKK